MADFNYHSWFPSYCLIEFPHCASGLSGEHQTPRPAGSFESHRSHRRSFGHSPHTRSVYEFLLGNYVNHGRVSVQLRVFVVDFPKAEKNHLIDSTIEERNAIMGMGLGG